MDRLEGAARVALAVSVVPDETMLPGSRFDSVCPVCDVGTLSWRRNRFSGKVSVRCSTSKCMPPVKFDFAKGKAWPPKVGH